MRLWKAILKGSKMKPQGWGVYFSSNGHSCALGAALDGTGKDCMSDVDYYIGKYFVKSFVISANCPTKCGAPFLNNVGSVIVHLNDRHLWTREAIAEWVRVQEKKMISEKWAKRQAFRKPIEIRTEEITQIKDGQLCPR